MTGEDVTITLQCKKCGGKKISLPDEPTDDSIATCASCGVVFGRWGNIKQVSVEGVRNGVRKKLQSTLSGIAKRSKNVAVTKGTAKR